MLTTSPLVLTKNNLRSGIVLFLPSKLLLFLSLQIPHIKQWGKLFICKPSDEDQIDLASNLVTQQQTLASLASLNTFQANPIPWTTSL